MNTIYRPQFWTDIEDGVAYLAEEASAEIAVRWHEEEAWFFAGFPATSCFTVSKVTHLKFCESSMA